MSHVQYNYTNCSIAQASAKLGVYRSKVAQLPDLIPAAPVKLRELLHLQAVKRALRAFRRHGEKSFRFFRARRSRWIIQGAL